MSNKTSVAPSFDEIRAILKQVSLSQKETDRQMQETDKKMQETGIQIKELRDSQKDTDRQIKELRDSQKDTDRQMKETDLFIKRTTKDLKRLEKLFTGQWGKLMETLVEGDLVELLKKRGIKITHNSTNAKENSGERRFEFDIISVNGQEIAVTEVKTTLTVQDVDRFIEKLKKFTSFMPEYKGRKIYGVVAFLKANETADTYAEKQGLFVIRATGSSASIINKEDFKPKAF